ncbi:hypothetical protein CPC08DRAFT_736568 [Agrocybe pediades]|nr:hypothetical protein CPC08DRAFT_736568 [Agrocybe pediades]
MEGLGFDYGLNGFEVYWRDHYDWLYQCGYELRPRYHPSWVPSWVRDPALKIKIPWCEDSVQTSRRNLMDATRIRDGCRVMLKRVDWSIHPEEAGLNFRLSRGDLGSDPRNHAVPLPEILEPPHEGERDIFILVMPLLSQYNDPQFRTFGEVIDFLQQVFEGVQFLHHHRIAHRDIHALNIMVDAKPLSSEEIHPVRPYKNRSFQKSVKKSTRTEHPVRYYLIDFGISRFYSADEEEPLELPIRGIDRTVPEFKNPGIPQNPFPTDIYYLGNMIREQFILGRVGSISTTGFYGFEFLLPLVTDMVHDDPRKRPTIDEVVGRFSSVVSKLSWWKLRSRLAPYGETARESRVRWFKHTLLIINHILRGFAPIPNPPPLPIPN